MHHWGAYFAKKGIEQIHEIHYEIVRVGITQEISSAIDYVA